MYICVKCVWGLNAHVCLLIYIWEMYVKCSCLPWACRALWEVMCVVGLCHVSSIGLHPANMYLLHPQTRPEPPTQSEVHLHDHIHTAGNWVPTETQQWGIMYKKRLPHISCCSTLLLKSWISKFCGCILAFFFFVVFTRFSQLYWHSSLRPFFLSHFWSSPPPFPFTFSHLSPGLATTPTLIPSLPPTVLIPLPPRRSVNTSGWASMTTGHQLFQISENHRK